MVQHGRLRLPATPDWTTGTGCTIGDHPSKDIAPIGRLGNSRIGVLTGPGTVNPSTALEKSFAINERFQLKIEGSFTSILNRVNLADPTNSIDNPSLGKITQRALRLRRLPHRPGISAYRVLVDDIN